MIKEVIENEILQKKLNLNTDLLKDSCKKLRKTIISFNKKFDDWGNFGENVPYTAKMWKKYNTFYYPYDEFYELFNAIRGTFNENNPFTSEKKYYIQSWLNYYEKGDFIDWHSHSNTPDRQFMSGYYCVCGEPSVTTFNYDDYECSVENKNDYLIFTKMGGQFKNFLHKTWPWDQDEPRISIAFEIIHREGIPKYFMKEEMINHWLPI